MNAPVIGTQSPVANLTMANDLKLVEAEGDVLGILRLHRDDIIGQTVDKAMPAAIAAAVVRSFKANRNSGKLESYNYDIPAAEVTVSVSPHPGNPRMLTQIEIRGQQQAEEETLRPVDCAPGSYAKDDFFDMAANAMSEGQDVAVTMIQVHGGLAEIDDTAMHRIVHDRAMESGANATSRLECGSYGVLHPGAHNTEKMLGDIADNAVSEGLISSFENLGAEQIESAPMGLDAATIRATLTDSATTLSDRIKGGFQRVGLGRRVDDTKRRVATLIVEVRRALRSGKILVESRPIFSLNREATAIHDVRAQPMLEGKVIDASVLSALDDSSGYKQELQFANITAAVKHQLDIKIWKNISTRVMTTVDASLLDDASTSKRIDQTLMALKFNPESLILCLPRDERTDRDQNSERHLRSAGKGEWRVAIADFYAFVKGEVELTGDSAIPGIPNAYIEVPVDRLEGLGGQKDGRFLVRSLIDTWRGQGTEIIATSVSTAKQEESLRDFGVRYAKGLRYGDWQMG